MQNSVAVFDRLEAEAGQAIDWRKVGSLRLASSADRWSEIRRSMTLAKSFGFDADCHMADGSGRHVHAAWQLVANARLRGTLSAVPAAESD